MNHNLSSDPLPNLLQSLIPSALHPFLLLSYPVYSTPTFLSSINPFYPARYWTLYDKGPQDIYFVAFCAVAFTMIREIVIRYVLRTFAWSWLNSGSRKGDRISRRQLRLREHTALRFAEQGWSFCYCTIFWTIGMVICPIYTKEEEADSSFRRSYVEYPMPLPLSNSGAHTHPFSFLHLPSSIIWLSSDGGSTKSLWFTARSGGKTTTKCSPTTSSLSLSLQQAMSATSPE